MTAHGDNLRGKAERGGEMLPRFDPLLHLNVVARLTRALEALEVGDTYLGFQILEDLRREYADATGLVGRWT